MRILIADDEEALVSALSERLTLKGHSVDTACDGAKAMAMLESMKYDIIFLDHNMPELTGLEMVKKMRQSHTDSKIVMISGYPEMEDFFARAVGADEYLVKPLKFKEVEDIILKYGR